MIIGYKNVDQRLQLASRPVDVIDGLLWIDLFNPTDEEEAMLEAKLGIDIPTREEMNEIEISSRLYVENGTLIMIARLPAKADTDDPEMAPVAFVVTSGPLVTVRYHEPRAFTTFPKRAQQIPLGCADAATLLSALLEAIIDRLADILERLGRDIDEISNMVFQQAKKSKTRGTRYQKVLEALGRKGDLTSNIRESLLTIDRLIGFFAQNEQSLKAGRNLASRLKTLSTDAKSLSDHAAFLAQKTTFLLDATLGMINIEQNSIIKIFSVAAVIFMPPTLIASIYGMNFNVMPELQWVFGYPMAILLMIGSAALAIWYFKRNGWL